MSFPLKGMINFRITQAGNHKIFGRLLREIKVKFSFFPHKITSANKYIPEGFFQDVQETILDHDWSSLIPIFDFFFNYKSVGIEIWLKYRITKITIWKQMYKSQLKVKWNNF